MQMKDLVWTEKYRPKTLEELIITDEDKSKLKTYIDNPLSMPNILFVGSPGTGKSTTALMIPHLTNCPQGDYIQMNSSTDRTIDAIRNRIVPFITSKRKSRTVPKFIHMDEFDGTGKIYQDALRGYMEGNYNKNCKFLLTANRISDIHSAIQGERCIIFDLASVPKQELMKRLTYICEQEHVSYTQEGLQKLVDINYPSRRKMVQQLQMNKDIGITIDTIKSMSELSDDFYKILITPSIDKRSYAAREYIIDNGLNPRELLKVSLFMTMKNTTLSPDFKYELSQYTANIDHAMADGADSEVQMWGFITYFTKNMR